MTVVQESFTVACEDDWLVCILTRLQGGIGSRGVLIAVGGPQYRVGSHRQFKLLADYLAQRGTPVMRFDYRGMGDSSGELRNFEHVSSDIAAAVDAFFSRVRGLNEVVIWGLCDAASAALLHACRDPRITGMILLNPWVRSEAGNARTQLRHYYLNRLLSPEPWRKLLRGDFDAAGSALSLGDTVRRALGIRHNAADAATPVDVSPTAGGALTERMADGLKCFKGRVLLILSGDDLTAREFEDVTSQSSVWRNLLDAPRVTLYVLKEATHTFSRREWRDQVASWTWGWVHSW